MDINMSKAYVYIITNWRNTVLYTGSTTNLKKRIYHHKNKLIPGFSKKYNLDKLIYYETCQNKHLALEREKQLKKGSRKNKIILIERSNPLWKDLYFE